jgi:hypothetical protein
MKKILGLLTLAILLGQSAFAIDIPKCGKMINQGWIKKYDYFGMYFHGLTVSLDGTKKQGTSHVTTESQLQLTTGMFDPGLWTNTTTGTSQSTSSWGECSLFADYIRNERAKIFMAENYNELKKDIVRGEGEYLQAMSEIYLCRADKQAFVSEALRENYKSIFSSDSAESFKQMKKVLDPKVKEIDHCIASL